MQTQQPQTMKLSGIKGNDLPQIVTILSELVNASSVVVDIDHEAQLDGKRDKPISPLSINYAVEFMANHINAVYVTCIIDSEGLFTVKAACYGLLIEANFYPTSYFVIKKAYSPAFFKTADDLRASLMRMFSLSRSTSFGYANISAIPSLVKSSITTQFDFIRDINPSTTTITAIYKSEHFKDVLHVIVKCFRVATQVKYVICEMSATDLNKALGGSHIYGEITLPETVLDKLISSY